MSDPVALTREVTTFGGGCFWCIEAIFDQLVGVTNVISGYMGGRVENPTYKAVCSGTTGHAEVVQVTFDPVQISFREVLEVFFSVHDPTTLNRQGADVGTQYRSAIFSHSEAQRATAVALIAELHAAKEWPNPIVTDVRPVGQFYAAEDYHQEYFAQNGRQPYCQFVVAPKVAKFRTRYVERLKK